MKFIRCIFAWIFWALGDAFFYVMCLIPSSESWCSFWYSVYNFFMTASSFIQGFGPGPWKKPEDH